MKVLTAFYTDTGTSKKNNQDALCLKVAETQIGKVIMAVICDGMGGLSNGEVASASVIQAFSSWFDYDLELILEKKDLKEVQKQWSLIINQQNQILIEYGRKNNMTMGTTLTALLMYDSKSIITCNIGDSRIYRLNHEMIKITEDHTIVEQEVKFGLLTEEQAKVDPRRNILLQCIGASGQANPDFKYLVPEAEEIWMLCSDGFPNKISNEEIYQYFAPNSINDEIIMEQRVKELIQLNRQRNEVDDISVILIKVGD